MRVVLVVQLPQGKKYSTIAGTGAIQTKCKCVTNQESKVAISTKKKKKKEAERKRQQDVSRLSSDLLRFGVIALCG